MNNERKERKMFGWMLLVCCRWQNSFTTLAMESSVVVTVVVNCTLVSHQRQTRDEKESKMWIGKLDERDVFISSVFVIRPFSLSHRLRCFYFIHRIACLPHLFCCPIHFFFTHNFCSLSFFWSVQLIRAFSFAWYFAF